MGSDDIWYWDIDGLGTTDQTLRLWNPQGEEVGSENRDGWSWSGDYPDVILELMPETLEGVVAIQRNRIVRGRPEEPEESSPDDRRLGPPEDLGRGDSGGRGRGDGDDNGRGGGENQGRGGSDNRGRGGSNERGRGGSGGRGR